MFHLCLLQPCVRYNVVPLPLFPCLLLCDSVKTQLGIGSDPWMAFFWAYDPAPALRKVTCPVLALNGELDMQVNAKENLETMELAFRQSGNKQTTIKALPKLNHLFQTAKTGSGQEYGNIEETISPVALQEVTKWLKSILARK